MLDGVDILVAMDEETTIVAIFRMRHVANVSGATSPDNESAGQLWSSCGGAEAPIPNVSAPALRRDGGLVLAVANVPD